MTGALVRAFLAMLVVAMPSAILPGVGADTQQMVALVALFGGALVFVEYNAVYPSLVEFRDAPPFNRLRFGLLFMIVLVLSLMLSADLAPTPLNRLFEALGLLIGQSLDFPYSPVRLATLVMAEGLAPERAAQVRAAVGTAYFLSVAALVVFVTILRVRGWPARHLAFNVWVNLPTFEPTAGGDVVGRLERDARINLSLGVLLPFLIPAVMSVLSLSFAPLTQGSPQTLIWTVAAWAFLPASLVMRGVAMARVAAMIRTKREGVAAAADKAAAPA